MMFRRALRRTFSFLSALLCATGAAAQGTTEATAPVEQPAALVRQPTRALLLDLAAAGPRVFAVGSHGVIVWTADAGRTWTQVAAPSSDMLTCVSFADAEHGWAGGHQGVILSTTDGGLSWTRIQAPTTVDDSILDILALPDGAVLAVGAYGFFLHSSDRGATWEKSNPLDEDLHLNRITAGASGALYLAGESGTLAVSRDRGHTWARLDAPYDGSFYGLHELTSGALLAYGLRGHIFTSADAGSTWSQASIEQAGLVSTCTELPSGAIAASGAGGGLFISRDGGRSFAADKPTGLTAAAEILAVADVLYAVGDTGVKGIQLPKP